MNVEVRPQKLKQTKLWELALRFGFGGLCTILAGLIAKHFGAAVGGLFLAFPAIFPSGASLIESHEEERKRKHGMRGTRRGREVAGVDAAGAAIGCAGLASFAAIVWRELPRHNALSVIALSTVAWAVVALAVWWLLRCRAGGLLRRKALLHRSRIQHLQSDCRTRSRENDERELDCAAGDRDQAK